MLKTTRRRALRSREDGGVRRPERDTDYRFTLANERTFLAWIRTCLALIAGGVAVRQVEPEPGAGGHDLAVALAVVCVTLGCVLALLSVRQWRRNDRAMRADRPLPVSRTPFLLAAGLVVIASIAVVFVV